jgi:hypothetical protein
MRVGFAKRMRLWLALAALVGVGASPPARAEDDRPPPPHQHNASWYSGWSLIGVGGVSSLLGVALTTRDEPGAATTGWVLAGVGTATWIGGAVILKLTERTKR